MYKSNKFIKKDQTKQIIIIRRSPHSNHISFYLKKSHKNHSLCQSMQKLSLHLAKDIIECNTCLNLLTNRILLEVVYINGIFIIHFSVTYNFMLLFVENGNFLFML